MEEIFKGLRSAQNLGLVDAVAARADEWALDVGAERFGAILSAMSRGRGAERWENLLRQTMSFLL